MVENLYQMRDYEAVKKGREAFARAMLDSKQEQTMGARMRAVSPLAEAARTHHEPKEPA